jgi:lauroyl/myristoyl acyltransferase
MRVLPATVGYRLAALAGAIAYAVARSRSGIIKANLDHILPDSAESDRRRLTKQTFVNLFQAVVDLFRLPSLPHGALQALVDVRGLEHLDQALGAGRGVIVVTPHLGPYELGAAVLAARGYDVHGMVEDLDPETNAALAKYREATGMKLISRQRGLRALYRILEGGAIALLVADRVVGDGTEGLIVDFANGQRPVPTGPAAFALATGAPVVVGYITKTDDRAFRYVINIEPPIFPGARTRAAVEGLTRLIGARLGTAVSLHPDQWFVFQPGWVGRDGDA